MDCALVRMNELTSAKIVLILVLMEDALAQREGRVGWQARRRLNPCFNGRCTHTMTRGLQACITES